MVAGNKVELAAERDARAVDWFAARKMMSRSLGRRRDGRFAPISLEHGRFAVGRAFPGDADGHHRQECAAE